MELSANSEISKSLQQNSVEIRKELDETVWLGIQDNGVREQFYEKWNDFQQAATLGHSIKQRLDTELNPQNLENEGL